MKEFEDLLSGVRSAMERRSHRHEGVPDELASTGIPGLDEILSGGLPANQMFIIQGDPGAGKTTLAFQFLLEACAAARRRST